MLTTKDAVVTGGYFLSEKTLCKTLLTALAPSEAPRTATDASMNGPTVCAFDRRFLRSIQSLSEELEQFHEAGSVSTQLLDPCNDDLVQFATSDWMIGLLFADSFFPRTSDNISDPLGDLEIQHKLVLRRASLFLLWAERMKPNLGIARVISKRLAWFFETASQASKLDDMMDESTALALLQLKYGLAV